MPGEPTREAIAFPMERDEKMRECLVSIAASSVLVRCYDLADRYVSVVRDERHSQLTQRFRQYAALVKLGSHDKIASLDKDVRELLNYEKESPFMGREEERDRGQRISNKRRQIVEKLGQLVEIIGRNRELETTLRQHKIDHLARHMAGMIYQFLLDSKVAIDPANLPRIDVQDFISGVGRDGKVTVGGSEILGSRLKGDKVSLLELRISKDLGDAVNRELRSLVDRKVAGEGSAREEVARGQDRARRRATGAYVVGPTLVPAPVPAPVLAGAGVVAERHDPAAVPVPAQFPPPPVTDTSVAPVRAGVPAGVPAPFYPVGAYVVGPSAVRAPVLADAGVVVERHDPAAVPAPAQFPPPPVTDTSVAPVRAGADVAPPTGVPTPALFAPPPVTDTSVAPVRAGVPVGAEDEGYPNLDTTVARSTGDLFAPPLSTRFAARVLFPPPPPTTQFAVPAGVPEDEEYPTLSTTATRRQSIPAPVSRRPFVPDGTSTRADIAGLLVHGSIQLDQVVDAEADAKVYRLHHDVKSLNEWLYFYFSSDEAVIRKAYVEYLGAYENPDEMEKHRAYKRFMREVYSLEAQEMVLVQNAPSEDIDYQRAKLKGVLLVALHVAQFHKENAPATGREQRIQQNTIAALENRITLLSYQNTHTREKSNAPIDQRKPTMIPGINVAFDELRIILRHLGLFKWQAKKSAKKLRELAESGREVTAKKVIDIFTRPTWSWSTNARMTEVLLNFGIITAEFAKCLRDYIRTKRTAADSWLYRNGQDEIDRPSLATILTVQGDDRSDVFGDAEESPYRIDDNGYTLSPELNEQIAQWGI
jgi:hypothetical protein